MSFWETPAGPQFVVSFHVHERGGERGPREYEKAEVAAKRYSATFSLRDLATAAQIQPSDLDGSTCDTRTFLTKFHPVQLEPSTMPST